MKKTRLAVEKLEEDLRKEMIIWYKEVRKIGIEMVKINIQLCCEAKKFLETDLPKSNLKRTRSTKVYSFIP
jgi:hypothetical protein